jgi:hypothetical protein
VPINGIEGTRLRAGRYVPIGRRDGRDGKYRETAMPRALGACVAGKLNFTVVSALIVFYNYFCVK